MLISLILQICEFSIEFILGNVAIATRQAFLVFSKIICDKSQ